MEDASLAKQERASHILDVAADLLLRWGYKRMTMEDIARQAEIGTGTIYLHWKTKEALFECVLLREVVILWRTLLERIRADPEEVLLHLVMRSMLLLSRQRPIARALFTRDVTVLGKLAQGKMMKGAGQLVPAKDFIQLLRDLGLMRADMDLSAQAYAFAATVTGFTVVDPFLENENELSLEEKAEAMARIIRLGFEPEQPPPHALLQEQVASVMIQLLEKICASCEQQIQERMLS